MLYIEEVQLMKRKRFSSVICCMIIKKKDWRKAMKGKAASVMKIQEIEYNKVKIQDYVLNHAFELELKYLNELDSDRLLAGFRETAGLALKASRYPGWESTEIQGHTMGHYLTALAQAYGATKKKELLDQIEYILKELHSCQAEDGYLFASPRELFDRVENKQPVWVPWYTMHKIMEGLLAAFHFTGNHTAKLVMTELGLWIYRRCTGWSEETRDLVLAVEYGGMNDCLYDLYLATGDERFMEAAHQFDELPLFQAMYEKRDILNGLHANTTIPKIIGALKRYVAVGEEYYLQTAENFWEMVLTHHTYITGGNSEWEHFGEPDILDDERTACNCETCNTYNMLKLTKLLFQITGEKKYADYYERAFINAILSSQNPVTGMTTYFQPMATGFFKVYSTPFDRFWCCTGTGMENFTKLTEGIYFQDTDKIYINRFVTSSVDIEEYGLKLCVEADFLRSQTVRLWMEKSEDTEQDSAGLQKSVRKLQTLPIAVRIPDWVQGEILVQQENALGEITTIYGSIENGYLLLEWKWQEQDKIENNQIQITFPMEITLHTLPDNENAVCFTYGPYVLSAGLGKEQMEMTVTGVDVLVPKKEMPIQDYIILEKTDIASWKNQIQEYMVKTPGKIEFILKNSEAGRELVFQPHYAKYDERYGIYFRIYEKGSKELESVLNHQAEKDLLSRSQVDTIPIGNDQYELAHSIRGEKTDTARVGGHRCRFAKEDGWFSYEMKIESGKKLCVTYYSKDAGSCFDIYLNDELFVREKLTEEKEEFYTREYDLYGKKDDKVVVTFYNRNTEKECRIFDEIYVMRDIPTETRDTV